MSSVLIDNEYLYEHAIRVAAKLLGLRVDRDRRAVVFLKPLLDRILGGESERHEAIIYGTADPVKQGVYNYLNKTGFVVKTHRRNFRTGKPEGCHESMAEDVRRIASESLAVPGLESLVIMSGDSRLVPCLRDVLQSTDLTVEIYGFADTIASQLHGLAELHRGQMRIHTLDDVAIYDYFGFDTLYNPARGGRMRRDLTFVVTFTRRTTQDQTPCDAAWQFARSYQANSEKYKQQKTGSKKKAAHIRQKEASCDDGMDSSVLDDDEREAVRETVTNLIGLTVKMPTRSEWSRGENRSQLHVVVSGPADGVELTELLSGDLRAFEGVIRGHFVEGYGHLDMHMATLCQVQAGPMPACAVLQKILDAKQDPRGHHHTHTQPAAAATEEEPPASSGDWTTVIRADKRKHKARTHEPCAFGFGCRYGVKCFFSHTKKQCEFFEMHGRGNRYYKVSNCIKVNCEYLGRTHLCPYLHKGEQV